MIPLLVLAPTMVMAMTPAEDGRQGGISDAKGEAMDSGVYCAKYGPSGTASDQCYNAYHLAFVQTCLSNSTLMKYTDPAPEYPDCQDAVQYFKNLTSIHTNTK